MMWLKSFALVGCSGAGAAELGEAGAHGHKTANRRACRTGRCAGSTIPLVALATIFDGFDTFIPSYMIHFVVEPWRLSHGQAGLLMSSGLIGFGIGSLVHGVVADRIGRRPTLIAGLLTAGVFSLATAALAESFAVFAAGRDRYGARRAATAGDCLHQRVFATSRA